MKQDLEQILKQVSRCPALAICLDFDGTLVPIQRHPEMCRLNQSQRDILRSLATHSRARVAVVTGRGLEDIQTRVGISEIIYAGNHGLEIHGAGHDFQIARANLIRESLACLRAELFLLLDGIHGCWMEDKGLTVTVHYREVAEVEIPRISGIVQSHLSQWPEFIVRGGKAVFEIRPRVDWNKSHAVQWISQHAFPDSKEPLVIFCGDDLTDQDVFQKMTDALTIQVGDCHTTSAQYCVESPDELWNSLRLLEALL